LRTPIIEQRQFTDFSKKGGLVGPLLLWKRDQIEYLNEVLLLSRNGAETCGLLDYGFGWRLIVGYKIRIDNLTE
jgi:hypothetical protein